MIETFTDEELWDELKTRYNNCVLAYEKDVVGDNEVLNNNVIWHGSHSSILGLLKYGERYLAIIIDSSFMGMLKDD